MTPSDLKWHVEQTDSNFFDRSSMKFFGDTMKNYGVRKNVISTYSDNAPVEVWELYRKRPVKNGLRSSAYFRADSFERTFEKKD